MNGIIRYINKRINTTFTTLLSEKRQKHSEKPEKFYEMVEKICAGSRVDYFARRVREG